MFCNRLRARIVGGQRKGRIVVEPVEHHPEIPHSTVDILLGIERIHNAEIARSRRHELHQAHCAFWGYRRRIEARFGPDDCLHQITIQTVEFACHLYVRIVGGLVGQVEEGGKSSRLISLDILCRSGNISEN